MQYNNLIARLSRVCSTPHPPNCCLAQRAFPSSYPRLPNPEMSASKLNSDLFERGIKAVLGDSEATAIHMQRGRSNSAC